ncbi:hypothetical protein AK88_05552 [Plasmodium fragile]|uniref:Tryptophan/threonine-rich plasmodium antigen C-terminal domain-containing protein n=1 Tax=Plasmodium fragile TaxID=5857 RepID=A0A0D9QDB9_PLAFR|nr:uncharacterized protein AK88_05552 [Plasmodium fragile]KJP84817.1 hypothetical protein AK88_05552 [Plasmodium fragile]
MKEWFDDVHFNLLKNLKQDMTQFKNKKIKEWLMYHWESNEHGSDSESFEHLGTLTLLKLARSREWYRANPNIIKQGKKLLACLLMKENEYLGQQWENWTRWKNDKLIMTDSMCTTLFGKRITKKEWNQVVNEIKM